MDINTVNADFFGLITELCKSLLKKYPVECLDGRDVVRILNKMRRISFEIMLKKHPESLQFYDNQKTEESDSITDLLKYSFVLKTSLGSLSRAAKLEDALNQLVDDDGNCDSNIKSILQFLYCLKSYRATENSDLNIFHFNEKHPALPESDHGPKEVPHYQIYPQSAFMLSDKMEQLVQSEHDNFARVNFEAPFSSLSQSSMRRANNEFSMISSLTPYDLNAIGSIEGGYQLNYESTENESFWNEDEVQSESADSSASSSASTSSGINLMWPSNLGLCSEPESRTWETLGRVEVTNDAQFALESNGAIQHLQDFQNILIVSSEISQPRKRQSNVLSIREFTENIKLVLLGIESSCFIWDSEVGFVFQKNTVVPGLSVEALTSICPDITHWATCYKLLSILVKPNRETGKFRQDGLIFKAMCGNIDDILIHYQAVILQVFGYDKPDELLSLLHRLRDVGLLISEVARLCRCDHTRQTTLGEGTGILSHIYNHVTRVTKPNIALVYYSVLKSCCEIYFQMLEKWLFESQCDEAYGEFMIKIRGQYLRNRGHKFWTKCFGINNESVPGFLKRLTDSILECGKAVRLLKICDPKNSLCNLFATSRPKVKVCLSVNMLLEQEEICQRYMSRGIEMLGTNVTVSSALREIKAIDKVKVELVAAAQYDTLQRIKKDHEEAKLLLAKNKRELLADQKKQLEDAASRRVQARVDQINEDKLFIAKQIAEEEKIKMAQEAETKVVVEYYKDLAEEARKRRLRATWRTKRLALFDERVDAIISAKHHDSNPLAEPSIVTVHSNIKTDNSSGDENCNKSDKKVSIEEKHTKEETTKAHRPTALPVKVSDDRILTNKSLENIERMSINETDAILKDLKENKNLITQSQKEFPYTSMRKNETLNRNENSAVKMIIVDKEGNESTILVKTEENNEQKSTVEVRNVNNMVLDNINNQDNRRNKLINIVEASQLSHSAVNDANDTTPMSCTTDSYVPSAIGSSVLYNCTEAGSFGGSKTDFETPTTPGDYLTRNTMKQGLAIENIFSRSNSQFFNAFGLDDDIPATFESSLTTADVEMIDNTSLQVYLEKSVLIPLRVQSRLANSAVVKCLLYDYKILSHFQSLRSFFFLLNGEFARNLTNPLYKKFYEISMPGDLFNSATLTNLLDNALHCSLNNSYTNSELLSLTVIEKPSQLRILDPEALHCLCLHYKVSWPLNIVLDEALMQQYSKVFKFLLMIGRVLWVLQEDFCILKNGRKATMSYQYHRVQLFRHAMMQFMTALHNYLTCSVLHASWSEFEKDLENAMTLDQIYTTHVSYIKKILSRCMLTNRGEKLRTCLGKTFQLILKFHNTLRSHEWIHTLNGYNHPNYKKLEQMYEAFCIMRTYPAQVVDRYANSGYQMHLTHFLDSLNINPLFNL